MLLVRLQLLKRRGIGLHLLLLHTRGELVGLMLRLPQMRLRLRLAPGDELAQRTGEASTGSACLARRALGLLRLRPPACRSHG